jgi:carboxymethylenebutenolidase
MTTAVRFAGKGGADLGGVSGEPAGVDKVGAVVVVQEWHGVNDVVKALVDRFAAAGFLAIAPDLYHGKLAKNTEEAAALMNALDKTEAVAEIGAAVAHVKASPRSNGKVAIVGFCLGGALTFASARHLERITCAVPFYGIPGFPMEEYAKIKAPVLAHFAKTDDWAKASTAEEIQKAINGAGGSMELHVYDAGHAFMRAGDPAVYDEASAAVAWDRTIAFLKKHLA